MQMRDMAERYCALIERADEVNREAFATAVVAALAELVAAALALPDVEPTDAEMPGRPSDAQWGERFAAVQRVLGDWDAYWTTATAMPVGYEVPEAVLLPVADDLADVWRDLKTGLLALEAGSPPRDVLWDWRFGFTTHWGRHATEALRGLHARLADGGGWPAAGDAG